jgi:hypothetical protein
MAWCCERLRNGQASEGAAQQDERNGNAQVHPETRVFGGLGVDVLKDIDGALEERDSLHDGCEKLENTESECVDAGGRSDAIGRSRRGSEGAVHDGGDDAL